MPLPKKRAYVNQESHSRPAPKRPGTSTHNENSYVDSPQFPGWQKGNAPHEVQAFIRDQVRRKGFVFSGGTTPQDFKLTLSGSARFFYGLTFENKIGTVTLTINNEVVFENVSARFLQFGQTNQDYYAVNRPLSGQDSITITITGFAGYTNEQMEVVYK